MALSTNCLIFIYIHQYCFEDFLWQINGCTVITLKKTYMPVGFLLCALMKTGLPLSLCTCCISIFQWCCPGQVFTIFSHLSDASILFEIPYKFTYFNVPTYFSISKLITGISVYVYTCMLHYMTQSVHCTPPFEPMYFTVETKM